MGADLHSNEGNILMFWRFIQIKSEAGDTSWLQADGLLGNYLERGLLCYEFV